MKLLPTYVRSFSTILNATIKADSTCEESFIRFFSGIPEFYADVIITDPPYFLFQRRRRDNRLRDLKPHRRLDNDDAVPRFLDAADYQNFTKSWLNNCLKYALKPTGVIIVWCNPIGKSILLKISTENGYGLVGEYVWAKSTSTIYSSKLSIKNETLMRVCESALIFAPIHMCDKHKIDIRDRNIPMSVVSGYLSHEREKSAHPHPCHKPTDILEPLIRGWTSENDIIFDPFAGSGAILTTSLKIGRGRKVVGFEKLDYWVEYSNRLIRSNTWN